jgi:hypothetical protein
MSMKRAVPVILLALLVLPAAGSAGLAGPPDFDAQTRRVYEKVELVYRNVCRARFLTLREQLPCLEAEFKFRAPNVIEREPPATFKTWAPTAATYDEAWRQVLVLTSFRAIAEHLQKQVDAGTLSDRAAMDELEESLMRVVDPPDGTRAAR